MKQETELLIKYLQKYFFDNMNYYCEYKKNSFNFYLEDNFLIIKYKRKEYKATIISKNEDYYWYISDYDNKYYSTISLQKTSSIEPILEIIKNDYYLKGGE